MKKLPHNFADRLTAAIQRTKAPICVGLDPRLKNIPAFMQRPIMGKKGRSFEAVAQIFLDFNKAIIDEICELVPVVKVQFAFYLQYGFAGVWAFEETCSYAREKGLLVIADAKCNDIGSTAEAYAHAFLGTSDVFGEEVMTMACDAVTINPYLGFDGVKPFITACKEHGKGIFILAKTSNASSGDIQDQLAGVHTIYELVAQLIESWGADEIGESGYSSIGAVVGATFPSEGKKLRGMMPHTYFLVPGYGAQGGRAQDMAGYFDKKGLGALINSSRDIIFAWERQGDERNFAAAARAAVLQMKEELKMK